jgi:hypothetical protein
MPTPLSARARTITTNLTQALDWVSESINPDIQNNDLLKKDLRRSIFQTKKLELAASAKMCVGVYGASQAGKSYLVSVLARQGSAPLTAMLGDREVDFIRHINPSGDKESTGLVTRFTTDRITTPLKYPIKAKLLSELDLIKIFVNSFANDLIADEQDDIDTHVSRVNSVLASCATLPRAESTLCVEDVYDLEDYCNTRFFSNIRMQALKKADFWTQAAQLLPILGADDRSKLLETLWEAIPALSASYRLLLGELKRLGFASFVHCSPEALFDVQNSEWVRGARSVINVSTLDAMGSAGDPSVEISTDRGLISHVPLGALCGLISELIIPLKEQPHEFFSCTDLLDFPGARSRNARPKNNSLLSSQSVQVENFLRGKVAYLFDKYSADLELSSMLLCVGPSNLEVVGLAGLVEDWILQTHGASPEDRQKLPNGLFLVLTKFDQEFSQGAGKALDGTRWTTRLEASLLKPFGAHCHRTSWVSRWDAQGAFSNTYWLRNPNVDQFGLIQYEGDIGRSPEVGFAPERLNHIASLRRDFIANTLVQQHFKSPSEAWDAGMQLNDGGIRYLVSGLSEICKPDVKQKQVEGRLIAIVRRCEQDLRKYFVSGDKQELLIEKRKLAGDFLRAGAMLFQKQRLGEFINFLLVSDLETQEIFLRVQNQYEREKNASRKDDAVQEQVAAPIDEDLAALLGLASEPNSSNGATTLAEEIAPLGDFSDRFVLNFFAQWNHAILAKATGGNATAYLHLDRDLLSRLLHEFERAARRTGLVEHLKSVMKVSYQYRSGSTKNWILRQTTVLTGLFNQFLVCGGFGVGQVLESQKVNTYDGKDTIIFSVVESGNEIDVPEIAEDFSKAYFIDWLQAVQYTIRENAEYMAQEAGDTQSNRQLGELLKHLAAAIKVIG